MRKHTEIITEVKRKIRFDELFQEIFPDHYHGRSSNCPFHEDDRASFEVHEDHGFCHAGCPPGNGSKSFDVISLWMAAKGVDFKTALRELAERCGVEAPTKQGQQGKSRGKVVQTYDYTDEDGTLLYQVCRFEPKDFRQRRPDPDRPGEWKWNLSGCRRVLYRLPEVINATAVLVCEGEKDCDALASLGFIATSNAAGAGKWHTVCEDGKPPEALHQKTIYIIPDNDNPGRHHADEVARSLHGFARVVKILDLGLAEKGADVSDFIALHGDEAKQKLMDIAKAAPAYEPADQEPVSPAPAEIHRTDMGNARRMADLFGDRIRFCYEIGWLVYDGRRWCPDKTCQVQALGKEIPRQLYAEAGKELDPDRRKELGEFALKCESASKIDAMIRLLPSEPNISVPHEVFDADPWLFNVVNGTVNLKTGELKPHSPADLITKIARVEYDPYASSDLIERVALEIMDGDVELAGFLRRLFGYGLTGLTKEQIWAFLWGKGANGKTTLITAIGHVMGDYATACAPETFLENPSRHVRNDLAGLRSARLITANEPSSKRPFDAEVIKAFTGEGLIKCRHLYREEFEYEPQGKLFFSANRRPAVTDNSHAFWRRLVLIPFKRMFVGNERDDTLRDKLRAEGAGILRWLVDGCLDWQRNGLQIPDSVRAAVEDYRISTDVLVGFLEAECVITPAAQVPVGALYERYQKFCAEKGGFKPWSRRRFNEDLHTRPNIERVKAGPREARYDAWRGIGLKDKTHETVATNTRCAQCDLEGPACDEWHKGMAKDPTNCKLYDAAVN